MKMKQSKGQLDSVTVWRWEKTLFRCIAYDSKPLLHFSILYIYIYISWKNVSNEMCIFVLRNNEKCFVLKEGNEETMYNMYSNIYHKAERLL